MTGSSLVKKVAAFASYILGALILVTKVLWPLFQSQAVASQGMVGPGVLVAFPNSGILGVGDQREPFSELVKKQLSRAEGAAAAHFFLSIPKLGIEQGLVKANSLDLDPEDHIGHLLGTRLPGEEGVSFLYGHSVLPWFFNPDDYNSIFSTLHQLDFGDSFNIAMADQRLHYEVVYKVTLKPDEVVPFITGDYFSKENASWVVLMTCTPPGLDTKRLLVVGKLR